MFLPIIRIKTQLQNRVIQTENNRMILTHNSSPACSLKAERINKQWMSRNCCNYSKCLALSKGFLKNKIATQIFNKIQCIKLVL